MDYNKHIDLKGSPDWQKFFYVKDYMGSTVRTSRKQQSFGDNYTDPAIGKTRSSWTDYYNINIMTATADYAPFNDRNLYQNNAIQTRLWPGKERDKESVNE